MLRIETGRWIKEKINERTCCLCASGQVEDEVHALLECSTYTRERRIMFQNILSRTGIDCRRMEDDTEWMVQMLIGVGSFGGRQKRDCIAKEVAKFLEKLFKRRAMLLKSD